MGLMAQSHDSYGPSTSASYGPSPSTSYGPSPAASYGPSPVASAQSHDCYGPSPAASGESEIGSSSRNGNDRRMRFMEKLVNTAENKIQIVFDGKRVRGASKLNR